ncbi:Uncharacterised protein [Mycobacteroides abscessus subsp. abscessus]|nr:Uncharacterised protein [Mycobacteroides abscessus subsp. abscessus]
MAMAGRSAVRMRARRSMERPSTAMNSSSAKTNARADSTPASPLRVVSSTLTTWRTSMSLNMVRISSPPTPRSASTDRNPSSMSSNRPE